MHILHLCISIYSLIVIYKVLMEELKTLKNIDKKLSAIIAILAFSIIDNVREKEKITPERILYNIGLDNKEIAQILNRKVNTVQKIIKRLKIKK